MRAQYVGPWRGQMRGLERNILKFRSMQMMLVIFYADDLKRTIVESVRATNRWLEIGGVVQNGFAKGVRDETRKAFKMIVAHGVISQDEADEMRKLFDFRNTIAHELHTLVADLSEETVAREHTEFSTRHRPYHYDAVERLQHFDRLIGERFQEHGFMMSFSFNPLVFRAAERTFLDEIARLRKTVDRLWKQRKREIAALNRELVLKGTGLTERNHPRDPLSQYDDGRLTARGVEICYRLFDLGRSVTAVAVLTGLSIKSARRRHSMWATAGGRDRPAVDLDALPRRKFYARYED